MELGSATSDAMRQAVPVRPREETIDAAILGTAAVLACVGLVALVTRVAGTGHSPAVAAMTVYGATLVTAYLSAALYRLAQGARWRAVCRTIDHCAIHLLIAGTYTPFAVLALRDRLGWLMLRPCGFWRLPGLASGLRHTSTSRGRRHCSTSSRAGSAWRGRRR